MDLTRQEWKGGGGTKGRPNEGLGLEGSGFNREAGVVQKASS